MKILLISGHGAGDSGATAKIGGVTYKEAEETIKVVKNVYEYLKAYASIDIYPTERNAFKDYKAGKLAADFSKYDFVLEIHFNACVNDLTGNGSTTGTEIYTPTGGSTAAAKAILNNIAALGLKNRGAKVYDYSVIAKAKRSGASAALAEVCFIDDKDDMQIYLNKNKEIAAAIAKGIISAYGLKSTAAAAKQEAEKVDIKKIDIKVNGKATKVEAVNIDGYNYIKAADIGPALGYKVSYDDKAKAAIFDGKSL